MRILLTIALAALASPALAGPPETSLRPMPRISTKQASFDSWVADFKSRASEAGIPAATLDTAFKGIAFNPEIVRKDRSQNEFTKTVWVYLDSAASDARISAGQKAMQREAATLAAIEKQYGVEKEIVAAIWGLESAYGTYRGSIPTIEALATLAYDGRRAEFFEAQLLEALRILAEGHTTPGHLRGSWAGAMGHTQFMPSSWRDHAQDFNGDGKRNIWDDDPSDALASAAAYLKANGWQHGVPWGLEVQLPAGFNYMLARRDLEKMPSEWANLGITAADGRPVPDYGPATILLPGGAQGAAFMIFRNFAVIESYNTADAYVIGVGHLADRLGGGPAIRHAWPRDDRALTFDERVEMQTLLQKRGFDPEKLDGRIGPLTINAVRAYQKAHGMVPDGYPSPGFLATLRQGS